jgi:hypothetical protein
MHPRRWNFATKEPNLIQIRRHALRAAALVGVLAATGASIMAAPVAASASSLTLNPAAVSAPAGVSLPLTSAAPLSTSMPGVDEFEHSCVNIAGAPVETAANSGKYLEPVECAEVFVKTGSINKVYVQNEVFCESTNSTGSVAGPTTACSNITEQIGAGIPGGTGDIPAQICGVDLGHSACTSGRESHAAFAFQYQPWRAGSMANKCSIWAESLRIAITLPDPAHDEYTRTIWATSPLDFLSATDPQSFCVAI